MKTGGVSDLIVADAPYCCTEMHGGFTETEYGRRGVNIQGD